MWSIKFPDDFFEIDPSLVTFLDKYPSVTKRKLSQEDLSVSKVFHAQRLGGLIVVFVKANDDQIFLLQCSLGPTGMKLVRHQVPPAKAANGHVGDITAVRFWPNQQYVILGFSNGILRFHDLEPKKSSKDIKPPFVDYNMDNYWLITLHDSANGAIKEIYPIDTVFGHLVLTCAEDGSILVHEVDANYEEIAEKSKESLADLEQQFGQQGEEAPVKKSLKSRLKLTWEDAAIAGQINDEKVILHSVFHWKKSVFSAYFQRT